jgi:hypothetical protein
MNSASAAKMWNTSCPPGMVVSIASCSDRNPTPRRRSSPTNVSLASRVLLTPLRRLSLGIPA